MSSIEIFNYIEKKEAIKASEKEWNNFISKDAINRILAAQQKNKELSR